MVEVVNDHTNKEVEGEEGSKYDEDNEVDVHVNVDFIGGLLSHLEGNGAECLDLKYIFIHYMHAHPLPRLRLAINTEKQLAEFNLRWLKVN